jgi:hypothetical protein
MTGFIYFLQKPGVEIPEVGQMELTLAFSPTVIFIGVYYI